MGQLQGDGLICMCSNSSTKGNILNTDENYKTLTQFVATYNFINNLTSYIATITDVKDA